MAVSSRAQALSRAATIWPVNGVPYSMSTIHQPDGYRQDCSGFVSLCWGLPTPGEDTQSLVTEGWMYEIPIATLQAGDAIGKCGPGTLGPVGHIQLFERWTTTGLVIWEQSGGRSGPWHHTIKAITPGYRAYRLAGIDGGATPAPPEPEDDMALYLVSAPGDPAVWLSDGLSRRGIHNAEEIQGWLNLGARRFVDVDLSWYGEPIGSAPVVVEVDAAAVRAAVRAELDATKLAGA
jgi:hypothetical protein